MTARFVRIGGGRRVNLAHVMLVQRHAGGAELTIANGEVVSITAAEAERVDGELDHAALTIVPAPPGLSVVRTRIDVRGQFQAEVEPLVAFSVEYCEGSTYLWPLTPGSDIRTRNARWAVVAPDGQVHRLGMSWKDLGTFEGHEQEQLSQRATEGSAPPGDAPR